MNDPTQDRDLEEAARLLRQAERILFITGAGISADSGLPTYRGIGGLYEDRDTDDGVPVEVALSGETMRHDPTLCWKYIHQIEAACRGAGPNRGHEVIAEVEAARPHCCVLTQNVDGFHRASGSRNVIDIHGDIHDLLCTSCPHRERVEDYAALAALPRCPRCEAVVRPGVVLFGELLPEQKCLDLERELVDGFDLVFSVGTTSVFPYIAQPVLTARNQGVPTIEINPGTSEVSSVVGLRLKDRAARTLDEIWQRVQGS